MCEYFVPFLLAQILTQFRWRRDGPRRELHHNIRSAATPKEQFFLFFALPAKSKSAKNCLRDGGAAARSTHSRSATLNGKLRTRRQHHHHCHRHRLRSALETSTNFHRSPLFSDERLENAGNDVRCSFSPLSENSNDSCADEISRAAAISRCRERNRDQFK